MDFPSSHGSGPICPNCAQTRNLKVRMRGPGPDPSGQSDDLFFVCERCGATLEDRRKRPREKTDGP
jgi:transposase-like protein